MEGLLQLLNQQVSNRTLTRFEIANYELSDIKSMLLNCYKAEVVKRKMKWVLDSATEERVGKAAKWLIGKNKTGLLLYGAACGTGKTTLANAMCTLIDYIFYSPYSNDRKSVTRVTALNLVKIYSDSPDYYRKLVNTELLCIDDIGTEPVNIKIYGNEFSPVTELIYNRYDNQRMTIATSNLSEEQLGERYGERINDRLREFFDRMHFDGKSYRK